jgi:ADP-heptose:LPS heptosyltransferase
MAEPFILLHPAAAFDTKQWEIEKFCELARLLSQKGNRIVGTAGPGEHQYLELLQSEVPEILTLGPLALEEFTALAARCCLYIGNDTGTTHIAAALNRPVLVIFGSSNSRVWYPWGTQFELIRSDLPCIPCPGYRCLHFDEPRCIRSISVPEVFEAARRLLE